MHSSFLPRRTLSFQQWLWVPVVFFHLCRAYCLVRWVPSRRWLPSALHLGIPSSSLTEAQLEQAQELALLIQGASRRLPWQSTCLMNALAAWQLLQQQGIHTQIQLGVKPDEEKGLGAHAWLLLGSEALLGGKEAPDFSPIGHFEPRSK